MDDGSRNLVVQKIKSKSDLAKLIGPRPRQRKVVICHGTFDVVHPGHVRHLLYAKSKADILVASLTCDDHVTKADMRPYVPQDLRAMNLAAFEMVDYVIIDDQATPLETLKQIQPDYFAKGYEYINGGLHPKTQEEVDVLESYGGEVLFTPGDVVYSSSKFIDTSPPDIKNEKIALLMGTEGFDFNSMRNLLGTFQKLKVHVVGDTIIDTLTRCAMIGGMTKTPTMSVRYEDREDFVGGAGIVAKHLAATGADVTFTTVLGKDDLAEFALDDLEKANVKCNPVIDPTRPTTNKNAICAADYRLLKIDTLDNREISDRIQDDFIRSIKAIEADIIVFSDFRHGIFNKTTIPKLTRAIPEKAFKVADSQVASRWGNITEFANFDLITPNEREARFALGDQDSVVRPLATALFEKARCKTLILKLGARGILTYRTRPAGDPRTIVSVDSFARNVIDPVGAGDALLAYACLAMVASKGNEAMASVLGAIAAGLECEADGNAIIRTSKVIERINELEQDAYYIRA